MQMRVEMVRREQMHMDLSVEHMGHLLAHLAQRMEAVQCELEDAILNHRERRDAAGLYDEEDEGLNGLLSNTRELIDAAADDVSSGLGTFGRSIVPALAASAKDLCTSSAHLSAAQPGQGAPPPSSAAEFKAVRRLVVWASSTSLGRICSDLPWESST
jgi:hypothetical protein